MIAPILLALMMAADSGQSTAAFEIPASAVLQAGCGGSTDGWAAAQTPDAADDPELVSIGRQDASCLLGAGVGFRDGSISGLVTTHQGVAGFVLRHREPREYLGIELNPASGLVQAKQWTRTGVDLLGSAVFSAAPTGATLEVKVLVAGARVAVLIDGRPILSAGGARAIGGGAGVLARPGAEARFRRIMFDDAGDEQNAGALFETAILPSATVGGRYDLRLDSEVDAGADAGTWSLAGGSLPTGLRLTRAGRILGTVRDEPGRFLLTLKAGQAAGRSELLVSRLGVEGITWPRFPFDPADRVEPSLALIYSTDNISPTVTFARLGYPGRLLFQLHGDHPRLKVVLMSSPATRYANGRTLADSPEAAATWKALALEPRFDWLELGGQGYSHSPPDDLSLDHHEFSTRQKGCNLDHARMGDLEYCRERFTLAREAYRAAGIPDERVALIRFPGSEDSPAALQAADEARFLAVLGGRHPFEADRDWWIPHPGGGEILEIENVNTLRLFTRSAALEEGLRGGAIAPAEATTSPEFTANVARGITLADQAAAGGGILNLADQWRETFAYVAGIMPRYLVLDAVLRAIEDRYGPRVWYPRGRELALWLDARRHSLVSWGTQADGGVHVEIEPPARWARLAPDGLETASLVIHLPARFGPVREITIQQEGGVSRQLEASRWWRIDNSVVVVFPMRSRTRLHIARP